MIKLPFIHVGLKSHFLNPLAPADSLPLTRIKTSFSNLGVKMKPNLKLDYMTELRSNVLFSVQAPAGNQTFS